EIRIFTGVISATYDDDRAAVAQHTAGHGRNRPGLSDAAHPRRASGIVGLLVGAARFPLELRRCRIGDIERVDRPAAAAHRRIDPDTRVIRRLVDPDRAVEVIVLGHRGRSDSGWHRGIADYRAVVHQPRDAGGWPRRR